VTVADDDRFSFTDGTDDLPFSISAWVKMKDASAFVIASKHVSAREWVFRTDGSDKLLLNISDTTNTPERLADSALTAYEGSWVHVCATYAGSGPSAASGNAFSAAADGVTLYVNGSAVASTASNSGSYTGMSNGADPVTIGKQTSTYAKGHIRGLKIFNRSLTASEVAELARGNDLGFSEEWGGALGAVETSDFSAGTDGYAASGGTVAGNIDGIGGVDDTIRLTLNNANSIHYFSQSISAIPLGKRCRVEGDFYVSSANSNVDGINFGDFISGGKQITPSPDTWEHHTLEGVASGQIFRIYATDGGAFTFTDSGGDDVIYAKNLKITQIGTLASFSAERYDTSTSKLYDLSDNAFVGTGTSVSLTGREVPVYETGTWSPSLVGSGGSDFTYSAQEGYYTRNGDTVFIRGTIIVTGLGTSSGNISIAGFPFTASSGGNNSSVLSTYINNAAALTSQPIILMGDGTATGFLFDIGTTGQTSISISNLTATTVLRFSGTYQIQ
jgi:hypothetical protein